MFKDYENTRNNYLQVNKKIFPICKQCKPRKFKNYSSFTLVVMFKFYTRGILICYFQC